MIPVLGHFALILSLCFALLQSFAPLCLPRKHLYADTSLMAVAGQFGFLAWAMLCLILCFIMNDMTVAYVRDHSHQSLPILYRVGAAWGGHEGSLLLWCLILSGWTLAVRIFSKNHLPPHSFVKIIQILGVVSSGFLIFLLFTSNPFQRAYPTTLVSGDDLTPVLQDPGLIFHPPMLYLGYVGFAVAFAFAICALLEGKFEKNWVQALRPWVILPWSFLSMGIVLGSWWAYRELGWGGWWFWDPVENASLLPWLSATALLHALIVSEKRQVFKGWTLLLAIVTFALSLLGTFLVRSGVLVSVHTFANDPTRGIFLLSYLGTLIGGSLVLYSARIKYFYQAPRFSLLSRETFLLINSVILLTAVATICLGTLYPIILDSLNLAKISVGEPYFNTVFLPIILPLLFLMGAAPHMNWGQQQFRKLWHKLKFTLLLSIACGFMSPSLFGFHFIFMAAVGFTFAIWIIAATLQYALTLKKRHKSIALQYWSMIIAHVGIAIMVLGITATKTYSEERQVKLSPGEEVTIAGYHFYFKQIAETTAANFRGMTAEFLVSTDRHQAQLLTAQQRIYISHEQTLSRPGILANPIRDLYLALGAPLDKQAWSIRIYYKPLVRWIWFGGILLLISGLLSLLSYQKKSEEL